MKHYALPDISLHAECVILAAGDFPTGEVACALLNSAQRIICCDSAAEELLASGRTPDDVVGDLDSLSESARQRLADRLHHCPDQNTNDLWKSLSYALSLGYTHITVLGGCGRREDHTLGNIMLLAARMGEAEIQMVGDHGVFNFIDSAATFDSHKGQQVSLFTLSPDTTISTHGLMYEPPHNHLQAMWQGVSNQSLATSFTITTNGPTIVYRLF